MKKSTEYSDAPSVMVVRKKYILPLRITKALLAVCIALLLFYGLKLFWVTHPTKVTDNQDALLYQPWKIVEVEYEYAFLLYEYYPKTFYFPVDYKNQIWAVKLYGKDEFVLVKNGTLDNGSDKRTFRTTKELEGKVFAEPLALQGKTGKPEEIWKDGVRARMEKGKTDGEGIPATLTNTNLSCCLTFIRRQGSDGGLSEYLVSGILSKMLQVVNGIIILLVVCFFVHDRYKKEERLAEWFRRKERMEQREKRKWYDKD